MLTTQEQITIAYFARHKNYVFGGTILGLAMVFLLHHLSQGHYSVPSVWLVLLVLGCPFGLRTAQGRAWWLAISCMIAAAAGFYYLGVHSLMGIFCAMVIIITSGYGVCLRWNSP